MRPLTRYDHLDDKTGASASSMSSDINIKAATAAARMHMEQCCIPTSLLKRL